MTGGPPSTLPPLPPPSARNLRHAQSYAQLPRAGPSSQSTSSLSSLPPASFSSTRRLGPSMSTLDLRRPGPPKAQEPTPGPPPPSLHRRSSSQRLNAGFGGFPPTPASATNTGFGTLGRSGSFEPFSTSSSSHEHPHTAGQYPTPTSSRTYTTHTPTQAEFGPHSTPYGTGSLTQGYGLPSSPGVSGQLAGFHLTSPSHSRSFANTSPSTSTSLHHARSASGLRHSHSQDRRYEATDTPGHQTGMGQAAQRQSFNSALQAFYEEEPPPTPFSSRPYPMRNTFRRHSSESSLNSQDIGSESHSDQPRHSTASPDHNIDPFEPRPTHGFSALNSPLSSLTSQSQDTGLRRQRSTASYPRSRRYLRPPSRLENLIASSGMLDTISGDLGSLPPPPPLAQPAGRKTCDICGKIFARLSALTTHMLTHASTAILST